jgi:hypothetical protein
MNANASAHNHPKPQGVTDFFDGFLVHLDDAHPPTVPTGSLSAPDILHTHVRTAQYLSNMQQNGVGMDVLEGLMVMQDGRGGQSAPIQGSQQPSPQMLMEQQMRLNQLQQLYQLQTQIFQQQVSIPISVRSATAISVVAECGLHTLK